MSDSKLPFQSLIDSMVSTGMPEHEAIMLVQARLDIFTNEKNQLIQKYDFEANETSRLSSNAQITLATVLLPLVGLVFSQEKLLSTLSDIQRWLIIAIVGLLFLSILFGIFSHWAAASFFKKWASGSQESLKYIDDYFKDMKSTKELYDRFDEKLVALKLIKEGKLGTESSTHLWDYMQFGCVTAAGVMLVVTMYSILFDVPFWNN